MPQKYDEWQVTSDGEKIKKIRSVSIEPKEAEMLNGDSRITKLAYEPAKKAVKEPEPEQQDAEPTTEAPKPIQRRKRN